MTAFPANSASAPPRMQQLTIFIREQDHWHHRPLYLAILELVRARGGAGASVLKGQAGYSAANGSIHVHTLVDVAPALPLVVIIVDDAARIADLLPALEEMIAPHGGLLTVVDLVAHHYTHAARPHGGR